MFMSSVVFDEVDEKKPPVELGSGDGAGFLKKKDCTVTIN